MKRTALVTGASSEIGDSIVRRLVDTGIDCAISARREARIQSLADALEGAGARVVPIPADMELVEDRNRLVEATRAELGEPDILVHVAAQSAIEPLLDFSLQDWDRDFSINVDASFHLSQLVAPHMREVGWGRIVNIGSVFASFTANPWFYEGKWAPDTGSGPDRNPGYMASKGALKMLTRDLAAGMGPWGITVNMVSPGMIRLDDRPIEDERRSRVEQMTPVGRMGRPDDISNAVAFLISDDSDFVTGCDLIVDGGWTLW